MAENLVKDLITAGVHFGHRTSRWNPKMAPYIYAKKNQIHVMDIRETVRGLLRAKKYLKRVAEGGSLILFAGTKRQASGIIEREAARCGMPFVSERWLGGTLTNFRTIRNRLGRLEELEALRASDEINQYSKKMQSSLNREFRKMYRNLNGIRTMNRMPECVVVVDPNKEKNAIREAKALGIATIALIDTDCDPDSVDLPIPGNDDGLRSIELIFKHLADAVIEGKIGMAPPAEESAPVVAATPAAPAAAPAEFGGGDESPEGCWAGEPSLGFQHARAQRQSCQGRDKAGRDAFATRRPPDGGGCCCCSAATRRSFLRQCTGRCHLSAAAEAGF